MPAPSNDLRRGVLGIPAITFLVVSAAAPLTTIAGALSLAMLLGNGAGVVVTFVIVTLIMLLFSVGFCLMSQHISNTGGFYAFTARGLGGTAGGAAAFMALLAYNGMQIGLYGLFGAAASAFFIRSLGVHLPWYAYVYPALALTSFLGYRRIDLSARILCPLVLLEFAVVLILDVAIIHHGGKSGLNLEPFSLASFMSGAPSMAFVFCVASFMGFEATAIYSEEAKNPARTIPIATVLALLTIGIFYTLSAWCVVMGIGAGNVMQTLTSLADPTSIAFDLADLYVGRGLSLLMSFLFISSLYAALIAFHNATARYFYVLGREGLLPGKCGNTHSAHQSPHIGSLLQSGLAFAVVSVFVVAGMDPVLSLFAWLPQLGTVGLMALMALTSFAIARFFWRRKPLAKSRLAAGVILPILAGIILAFLALEAVLHFEVLTGASPMLAIGLTALIPLAAFIGIVRAVRLKKRNPAAYATLGAHRS